MPECPSSSRRSSESSRGPSAESCVTSAPERSRSSSVPGAAIKHVMSGINPQGCQVFSFKAPTSEDLDHDYLWSCAKHLPERGRIGIFNRSYYGEVLVVRVHEELLRKQKLPTRLVSKDIWEERFRDIRAWERYLENNGLIVRKFFLHVSRKEQRRRFLERIENPEKNWKFSATDARERGFWKDYMRAYEDMIRNTATKRSPGTSCRRTTNGSPGSWSRRPSSTRSPRSARVSEGRQGAARGARASPNGASRGEVGRAGRRERLGYRKDWLRPDTLAGLTVAAVVIPKQWPTPRSQACPSRSGCTRPSERARVHRDGRVHVRFAEEGPGRKNGETSPACRIAHLADL